MRLSYIIKRLLGQEVVKYGSLGTNSVVMLPKTYDNNQGNVYIGNNVTIYFNSRIQLFPDSVNANKKISVQIEDGVWIGQGFSLLAGEDITIGKDTVIASDVLITSENHSMDPESDIPYKDQELIRKPVIIGKGCWIGEKVCILPGVTIGDKCVIGASSVVTKSIPDYCIAAGNPAKIIKKYNFDAHQWEKCEEDG